MAYVPMQLIVERMITTVYTSNNYHHLRERDQSDRSQRGVLGHRLKISNFGVSTFQFSQGKIK